MNEVPITHCEPGVAYGSDYLRNRGKTLPAEITIWPRARDFVLFDGTGRPRAAICVRGSWLWNQELYVFLLERRKLIDTCLNEISESRGGYLPRESERMLESGNRRVDQSPEPQPADFGADANWWKRWLTEAPEPKHKQIDPKDSFGYAINYWLEQWR